MIRDQIWVSTYCVNMGLNFCIIDKNDNGMIKTYDMKRNKMSSSINPSDFKSN